MNGPVEEPPRWGLVPAALLVDPDVFGKDANAEWRNPSPAPPAAVIGAYYQHLVSCAVRDELRNRAWSLLDVASRLGGHPDQIRRKLRGQRRLGFEDAVSLALLFGIQVLPEPGSCEELLPLGLRHLDN